jgi:hypothetical protein
MKAMEILDTLNGYQAMRNESLRNVDAYWERREQRAFASDAPKSALLEMFAHKHGCFEVIDIQLNELARPVGMVPELGAPYTPRPVLTTEKPTPVGELAADPFGWDVV